MSNELAVVLKNVDASVYKTDLEENKTLSEGLFSAAPMLKISGKEFALVISGEVVQTFKELNAVIIAAGGISKRYYENAFTGKEATAPDCSSIDGVKPDDAIEIPQCELCAKCHRNAWGSSGKGKECKDHRRLVLCMIDEMDNSYKLYRLDIPAMSLKPLKFYGELLSTHKLPMSAVLTTIGMDAKETFAKLTFKPDSVLRADIYNGLIAKAKQDPLIHTTLTTASFEKVVDAEEVEVKKEPEKKPARKASPLKNLDLEKELDAAIAENLE